MTSYIYNMVDTWNNGATTFTAVKMNVTDTASNAASLLMDLQVGGASKFTVQKSGTTTINGFTLVNSNFTCNFTVTSSTYSLSGDTFIGRAGPDSFRFGQNAAAAAAQTFSVSSVSAGTSNTAGANFTINGSQSTGSGVGGSIIFQTAAANSGGGATVQNTLATAMVIDSVKTVRLGTGYTVATLPAAGTAGRRTYVTDATAPTFLGALIGGGAVVCPVFDNGTAWVSA